MKKTNFKFGMRGNEITDVDYNKTISETPLSKTIKKDNHLSNSVQDL